MKIGNKIKLIREFKNYTQEYMAERLNINQSAYSKYESDSIDFAISQLDKIAEIFCMKPEEILTFDEKVIFNNYGQNYNYAVNQETVTIYPGLNEKEKELYEKEKDLQNNIINHLKEKIAFLENLNEEKKK